MPAQHSIDTVSATLARSRLGVWPLVFTVMAAAAPLTVVAGGATTGFAVTGITGIPIAYVLVALLLALFSVGYVTMSRRVLNAGAFYTYVTHGLGKPAGVGAAFVALLAYNTMQIGLYGGFGAVLAQFLDDRAGVDLPWWLCAYAAWAIVGLLGVRRIDLNSRILATLLIAEIAVAVIFAAVHISHPAPGGISFGSLAPGNVLTAGIGAALAVDIAGFVGFEGTAVFSEESKDPHTTVARATYLALTIIGLLYAFCAWAMSVATGPTHIVDQARAQGTELIFTLVAPYLGQTVVDLGHLLFVTSLFAALLAFHNTAARYFFALGREGVLPAILGRTSPPFPGTVDRITRADRSRGDRAGRLRHRRLGPDRPALLLAHRPRRPRRPAPHDRHLDGRRRLLHRARQPRPPRPWPHPARAVHRSHRTGPRGDRDARRVRHPARRRPHLQPALATPRHLRRRRGGRHRVGADPQEHSAAGVRGDRTRRQQRHHRPAPTDTGRAVTAMRTYPSAAIRAATPADQQTVSDLLAEAFLHGDLADWLIPHLDTRARIYPHYFALHVEHAITHGQVEMTEDASRSGHLVSH
jgi:hypothetical protein